MNKNKVKVFGGIDFIIGLPKGKRLSIKNIKQFKTEAEAKRDCDHFSVGEGEDIDDCIFLFYSDLKDSGVK